MHENWVLFIAISLALVCNYEVDSIDTISQDENKGENKEEIKIDGQRHLNSDPQPVKIGVVGLGNRHDNLGGNHGHGHMHHPNKVGRYFTFSYLKAFGDISNHTRRIARNFKKCIVQFKSFQMQTLYFIPLIYQI